MKLLLVILALTAIVFAVNVEAKNTQDMSMEEYAAYSMEFFQQQRQERMAIQATTPNAGQGVDISQLHSTSVQKCMVDKGMLKYQHLTLRIISRYYIS